MRSCSSSSTTTCSCWSRRSTRRRASTGSSSTSAWTWPPASSSSKRYPLLFPSFRGLNWFYFRAVERPPFGRPSVPTADGHLLHPGGGVHVPQGQRRLLQEQALRPAPGEERHPTEAQARQGEARRPFRPGALRRHRGLQHRRLAGEEQGPAQRHGGAALPEGLSEAALSALRHVRRGRRCVFSAVGSMSTCGVLYTMEITLLFPADAGGSKRSAKKKGSSFQTVSAVFRVIMD